MISTDRITSYFDTFAAVLQGAEASGAAGGIFVATLSGFDPDNPLRRMGDVNLYLASHEYGFVEIGHAALCHAVLDLTIIGNA
jgi:D-sedoheptulose 7-phosphate isomerase